MARVASIFHGKKFTLFLNLSFLFLLSVFLVYITPSTNTVSPALQLLHVSEDNITCSSSNINQYKEYEAKCTYVKSNEDCKSDGYINYLQIFYCTFGHSPISGYTLLFLWLQILFYILGNTAANYFCSSLESLSRVLKLSPTIAGVTLLSLGNGANDVFASLVSFMGDGTGGVGLNSILGGVFFISCIVIAVISFSIGENQRQVSLDKTSFIRDVFFLLLSLCSLLLILVIGKINIYGAVCFISLYIVYVAVVSSTHMGWNKNREASPILPITKGSFECAPKADDSGTPLLGFTDDQKPVPDDNDNDDDQKARKGCFRCLVMCLFILELPLYLPRRITIPVVSEEKWSKPFAVVSVTLAPVLLALVWNSSRGSMSSETGLLINITAALVGVIFGSASLAATNSGKPPRTCLTPWLVGGFLMSIMWSYIVAEELVSLLVSLGIIFGISPSILGLTLLAWGNSLADLVANVSLAKKNGADGVQLAVSGCYAGPFFNTVVGLGVSLVFSCWSEYPSSYIIPKDPSLYETLGFLISALLWTLIILPKKDMKLDKVLGGGLLAIYVCFLSVRMVQTLGIVQLHGSL